MPRPIDHVISIADDTIDRRKIRQFIEKNEITMTEAAAMVGRSKFWMSKWLKHRCEVKDEEIAGWIDAFGVTRTDLLEGRYESLNSFELPGDAAA